MFAYTNVAIATSYLFSQFWGGGSMPPFSLRMVIPVASHLKAYADENLSREGSKGRSCSVGFYRIVWVLPAPFVF